MIISLKFDLILRVQLIVSQYVGSFNGMAQVTSHFSIITYFIDGGSLLTAVLK